jgi:predicted nucleotidyltransferase
MYLKDQDIKVIQELCKNHNVDKLYLFGSILNSSFNQSSDIDFLVRFKEIDLYSYFLNYITLKEKLEILLKRKIDLVEEQTLKNPVLIKSIEKNKTQIYG